MTLFLFAFLGFCIFMAFAAKGKVQKAPRTTDAFVEVGKAPPRPLVTAVAPKPSRTKQTSSECWFPPGTSFSLGQRIIPGGMIYVGQNLPPVSNSYLQHDPALINTTLAIARPGTTLSEQLPYWPQYRELDPISRTAYLDWLEGGRVDPDVQLGLVFLFFYGLERRIIADAAVDPAARSELPALFVEVERLLTIYGANNSFRNYASQLLLYTRIAYGSDPLYREPPTIGPQMQQQDPTVVAALGQAVAHGAALPPDLALGWYLVSEEARLRTPARRCWDQFIVLFRARYQDRYPDGFKVAPNKTRLKLVFKPASQTFGYGQLPFPLGDLPDVMRLTRPLRAIAEIVDSCTNELDAYSRLLGKNPAGAKNLQAAALLPPELSSAALSPEIAAVKARLDDLLDSKTTAVAKADLLFRQWPTASGDKMTKKETVELMHFLDRLDCGVEPDPRFGGAPLVKGTPIVLFRKVEGVKTNAPSSEYATAALVLHLATLVAMADGVVDQMERVALERHIENALGLSANEKRRLSAHIQWQIERGPKVAGLKKRLEQLDANTRRMIAELAVLVANADGRIETSEVDMLRRIYSLLGLDPNGVYQALGTTASAPSATRGPVVVRAARPVREGFEIPPQLTREAAKTPPAASVVDMDAVHRKMQETAQVSALLSDIFSEEEEATTLQAGAAPSSDSTIPGLDARQIIFLHLLKGRSHWEMVELEGLAESNAVLLEGTIEAINEIAFDRHGEPAIEWGEPVEINLNIVEELVA